MPTYVLRAAIAGTGLLLAATGDALAHAGGHQEASLLRGFLHPLAGADHVLAMVTVGAWAALLGGRALVALPAGFLLAMLAGFALSLTGAMIPQVEPMVLASLLVLGLLAATALAVPVAAAVAVVMLFGACHGYAHGSEIGSAWPLAYAAGFCAATAVLHAIGIALCLWSDRIVEAARVRSVARVIGAVTAAGGVVLILA